MAKEEKRKAEQAAALRRKKEMEDMDPRDMFKKGPESAEYSKWDADGIPTHDAAGEPLTKSAMKKLKAKMEKLLKKKKGSK